MKDRAAKASLRRHYCILRAGLGVFHVVRRLPTCPKPGTSFPKTVSASAKKVPEGGGAGVPIGLTAIFYNFTAQCKANCNVLPRTFCVILAHLTVDRFACIYLGGTQNNSVQGNPKHSPNEKCLLISMHHGAFSTAPGILKQIPHAEWHVDNYRPQDLFPAMTTGSKQPLNFSARACLQCIFLLFFVVPSPVVRCLLSLCASVPVGPTMIRRDGKVVISAMFLKNLNLRNKSKSTRPKFPRYFFFFHAGALCQA